MMDPGIERGGKTRRMCHSLHIVSLPPSLPPSLLPQATYWNVGFLNHWQWR